MNNLNDKVWFVYMGDHHEGPFSLNEIQSKVTAGEVGKSHHVWKEGMADWKMLSDVPECASVLNQGVKPPLEEPSVSEPSQVSTFSQSNMAQLGQPELVAPEELTGSYNTSTQELSASDLQLEERKKIEEELPPLATQATATKGGNPIPDLDVPTTSLPYATKLVDQAAGVPIQAGPYQPLQGAEELPSGEVELQTNSIVTRSIPREDGLLGKFTKLFKRPDNEEEGSSSHSSSVAATAPVERPDPSSRFRERSSRLPLILLLLILGGGGYGAYHFGLLNLRSLQPILKVAQPVLIQISQWIPGLESLFSSLPELKDVSKADYELLQAATSGNPVQGIRVAIAQSNRPGNQVVFYVSTNLPDGTKFEVYADGVEETLLNRRRFSARASGTTKNHLAKMSPLRGSGLLPQGRYQVFAFESNGQTPQVSAILNQTKATGVQLPSSVATGRKAVFQQAFFLGGKKDRQYFSRLSAYHQKLQEQAKREVDEVRNFLTTSIGQYKETVNQFISLSKGRKNRQKTRRWNQFSSKWSRLDASLKKESTSWTDQRIATYLYPKLYRELRDVIQRVSAVHQAQKNYFRKRRPGRADSAMVTGKLKETTGAIKLLQTKVDQLTKRPTEDNGLPARLKDHG